MHSNIINLIVLINIFKLYKVNYVRLYVYESDQAHLLINDTTAMFECFCVHWANQSYYGDIF
jgi:hypothetical protein